MKRRMALAGVVVLWVVVPMVCFFGACAMLQGPTVPEECQDSFLRTKYEYYKMGALVISLGNAQALKDNVYTKEQALKALSDVEAMLKNTETTYVELATYVLGKIKWVNEHAGIEVFILADFLVDMQANTAVIHPCDSELMLQDVGKLKLYTTMM